MRFILQMLLRVLPFLASPFGGGAEQSEAEGAADELLSIAAPSVSFADSSPNGGAKLPLLPL